MKTSICFHRSSKYMVQDSEGVERQKECRQTHTDPETNIETKTENKRHSLKFTCWVCWWKWLWGYLWIAEIGKKTHCSFVFLLSLNSSYILIHIPLHVVPKIQFEKKYASTGSNSGVLPSRRHVVHKIFWLSFDILTLNVPVPYKYGTRLSHNSHVLPTRVPCNRAVVQMCPCNSHCHASHGSMYFHPFAGRISMHFHALGWCSSDRIWLMWLNNMAGSYYVYLKRHCQMLHITV